MFQQSSNTPSLRTWLTMKSKKRKSRSLGRRTSSDRLWKTKIILSTPQHREKGLAQVGRRIKWAGRTKRSLRIEWKNLPRSHLKPTKEDRNSSNTSCLRELKAMLLAIIKTKDLLICLQIWVRANIKTLTLRHNTQIRTQITVRTLLITLPVLLTVTIKSLKADLDNSLKLCQVWTARI